MKRKILCLGMAAVLMMAVCGCSEKSKTAEKKTEETSTETSAESIQATEETSEEQTGKKSSEDVVENLLGSIDVESIEEEEPKTGQAVVDIPEGFKEYLAPSGIYVTTKYPEDGSNIYILTVPYYGDLPDEKGYKNKINENLSAQVGEVIDIKMTEYGETTVDGCEAVRALYTYSHDGMNFTRLEYTVNTDITTVIAYTQEGDADWMDAFEESAMTMRIE